MDPQARVFLDAAALAASPTLDSLPPEEGRVQFNALTDIFLPMIDVGAVTDHRSSGGVPFRVYRPAEAPEGRLPVVLYMHGGGWVVGNVGTHDTLCRHLANTSQVVIVSVEYRLAPEHPFPVPLEDCQDVLNHIVAEAESLGLDRKRIAVAGDSAGGNLATALAIKVRDGNGPAIRLQLLIYPVIDARCDTESYEAFAEDHGLTKQVMLWFWQCYASDAHGLHPLASPNQTSDLSGLPPARILTAEYDVLRDEGEAYAKQLEAAGVAVEWGRHEGLIHGFFHFSGFMDRGREVVLETGRWLGDRLRA
ncbi:MAG: acetyl esterase [Verrucomicrobiales bacterium]|jgi:acetyl esterase